MEIQLIQGQFSAKDAIEIITQMVNIKIRFHEDKIEHSANEEDIKMRETRIKRLQEDLFKLRKYIASKEKAIAVKSNIEIED